MSNNNAESFAKGLQIAKEIDLGVSIHFAEQNTQRPAKSNCSIETSVMECSTPINYPRYLSETQTLRYQLQEQNEVLKACLIYIQTNENRALPKNELLARIKQLLK